MNYYCINCSKTATQKEKVTCSICKRFSENPDSQYGVQDYVVEAGDDEDEE